MDIHTDYNDIKEITPDEISTLLYELYNSILEIKKEDVYKLKTLIERHQENKLFVTALKIIENN